MPQVSEWTFTADVASKINAIIAAHPDLPFSDAKVEERRKGSAKRRDLTLYDRNQKIALTGEVKMPDSPEGRTPFQQGLVEDAHEKADAVGVDYNFTWNVNRFVLWRTHESGKPIASREVEHYSVLPSPIHNADDLVNPRVSEQIDKFLLDFLYRYAALLSGEQPMRLLPLDEKFLLVYEASLEQPVAQTLTAISQEYKTPTFKRDLDEWMVAKQSWVISTSDEQVIRENLERSAKFTCYVLANKIVFYKALRRRFAKMPALRIPRAVTTGAELKQFFANLFGRAIEATGDYETVFNGDFGDSLPFLNNAAVASWRDLSEQTDGFDFTQINHEVIGQIFERLLSTEERHKYGYHYTRSEVVDLINTFCIRTAQARVLDPACGGGTFLVRAYARKRALSEGRIKHRDLISQLYGFDISAYATQLTTINLVTRDLVDEANYPLVARRDFFQVQRNDTPFQAPFKGENGQLTFEPISKVDAVVGNPPYVRQEKIGEYYGAEYKRGLQETIGKKEARGAGLSGRSDIHVYFFPHAATFLEDGGYLGLLTSSTWLDTTYGFRLQKYLLDNFEIIAIFESASEPWFTGARVTTAATILRRQSDPAKRAANIVHFVKIQRELSEMLRGCDNEDARRKYFERLRDHIERLKTNETTENWRVRSVLQGDLYKLGQLQIEVDVEESDEDNDEVVRQDTLRERNSEPYMAAQADDYVGYKWGIFLRAPEIFFRLLDSGRGRFVPLGEISRVEFGVKSGADDFFYPYDITDEELGRLTKGQFADYYGIRPFETKRTRVVRAGDGSVHLLEARFLQPEIHSLMEIHSIEIDPASHKRSILLCSISKEQLRARGFKHVLDYIRWGERERHHESATVRGRSEAGNLWYDLTEEVRPDLILPKLQQYRHIIALDARRFFCNSSLLEVFADQVPVGILCAILNSTVAALFKQFYARIHGREGSLQLDVYSAQMMPIPDARQADKAVLKRLSAALSSMRKRKALQLVDVDGTGDEWSGELALADRQELDDAVLEMLGITDADERKALRAELYAEMTTLYREIRTTEKKMQKFRSMTARHGRPTPQSLAEEIWESFAEKPIAKALGDFVPADAKTETVLLPPGKPALVLTDMFNPNSLQFGAHYVAMGSAERANYALQLSKDGTSGKVPIPADPAICQRALGEYRAHMEKMERMFAEGATALTADDQMQERVVKDLWRRAVRERHA